MSRIAVLTSLVTAPKAIGAAAPNVADFVDITAWRLAVIFAPRYAAMKIVGDGALTIDNGVLWGLVLGTPCKLGDVNKASQVVIPDAAHGWADETQDVGIATGLYVQGTVVGGNATVVFAPCDTREGM